MTDRTNTQQSAPPSEQAEQHGASNADLERLIRAYDWSSTPLGPMESWSQILRTSVDIMLQTPVPMTMLWGPDGRLIYNAGYSVIAGAKHPHILGVSAFDAWPEVADFNRNVIQLGLAGTASTYRDTPLVLERGRGPEHLWFDINYSPILDEIGKPAGVMAIVVETTKRVLEQRLRQETEERFQLALEAASMIGVCEFNFITDQVFADARFAEMFGVSPERAAQNAPLSEFLQGIHPEDVDEIADAIQYTIETHTIYNQEYRLRNLDGLIRYVLARGRIFKDHDGNWSRFVVVVVDITEQKRTEQALRDSREELQHITDEMPELVSYLDRSLTYRFVNRSYEEWLGLPRSEIINRFAGDVLGAEAFSVREPMLRRALAGEEIVFEAPLQIKARLRETEVRMFPRRAQDGTILGVYVFVLDISDRKQAADVLRSLNRGLKEEVEAQVRERDRIWNLSRDPFLIADTDGRWLSVSPAWTAILGWNAHELLGHTSEWMEHPDDRDRTRSEVDHLASGSTTMQFENRFRHKDGSYRWFSWTAVEDEGLLYCVARDITAEHQHKLELEQMQEQLRQAQKMEAIGQLTGGIAHDFNNMLTGITGALELLQRRVAAGRLEGLDRYINTAITSANRAAALTHRLLAFSRRQSLDMQPTDINNLVVSLEDLLRRTMGENISLEMDLKAGLWPAHTDANQVENALLNLCINARDAMPQGGKLTVETTNTTLSELYTRDYEDLDPGDYVTMSVSDTGTGMPADIVARAFDPFFTTKPTGQGTGLGLSMIYGFVKQSGGHVRIYSEVGHGTTIKLFLPRYISEYTQQLEDSRAEWARANADEHVLLVEDDSAVRMVVVDVLSELGYTVMESADPRAALTYLDSDQRIDLLITDVGLPGMSGRELADIARKHRPHLPILFVTGYAEGAAIRSGFLDAGMDFISKPFDIDALASKIRQTLGH